MKLTVVLRMRDKDKKSELFLRWRGLHAMPDGFDLKIEIRCHDVGIVGRRACNVIRKFIWRRPRRICRRDICAFVRRTAQPKYRQSNQKKKQDGHKHEIVFAHSL